MLLELNESEEKTWSEIEPLLEAAMGQLGEKDQNALVLRFFEDRTFKDISSSLGTTEAAAKMRVNRALEKLRVFFTKRGLTLSATGIAAAISAHSVQAAPAGLATSVTVAAVQGTAVTTSTLTLIKTTFETYGLDETENCRCSERYCVTGRRHGYCEFAACQSKC